MPHGSDDANSLIRIGRNAPVKATASGDRADGSLIGPVQPDNGKKPADTIFFVNEAVGTPQTVQRDLQALANTGASVVGVYNQSHGIVSDFKDVFAERAGKKVEPAVLTVQKVVEDALAQGKPVHLAGHSQGALLVSVALQRVADGLKAKGLSDAEVKQKLSTVQVETFAGVADHYPDGPKYTHYVNKDDLPPRLLGVTRKDAHPGEGAQIRTFTEVKRPQGLKAGSFGDLIARLFDKTTHGAADVYFAHRQGQ
jgi:hypothetical protein